MTTALVAERPTPAVPPAVRVPWKQPTTPMSRPKTAVLAVVGMRSLNFTHSKPWPME